METRQKLPRIVLLTSYLLFSILVVFVLVVGRRFLYPLALGSLLAFLLFPLADFLERRLGIARILSNIISILFALAVLYGIFYLFYKQLLGLFSDLPALKASALSNIDNLLHNFETRFGLRQDSTRALIKESVGNLFDLGGQHLSEAFQATTGTILRIAILPVFIFFMLYYRDKVYTFLIMVAAPNDRPLVCKVINEISKVTWQYMSGMSVVVLVLCVVNSFGLYLVGVEYYILFGIISAVCNFIPYFGTLIGFAFPLFFTIVAQGEPNVIIGVIVLFFIIQFIENNILTPSIVGGNLRLNPFVIILGLIFGAMIWGIPGMIVIVPAIAMLRIVAENIERWKPLAFILSTGGTQEHAITRRKIIVLLEKIRRRVLFKPRRLRRKPAQ